MTYHAIQLALQPLFVTITLNRPEKRNAISYELIAELLTAIEEAAASDARVLIITGAGSAFCSGMDLDDLKGLIGRSPEQNLRDSETVAKLFRAIYEFPKPTIAAVNGAAVAGGAGLATLCDFTLAVPEAKFGYSEVRIGFIPAIVSTFLLRQVREKHARDLLLTGKLINADEALRIGLINEVVPPEKLMARTTKLAEQLAANSPASLVATKRLLRDLMGAEVDAHLRLSVKENAAIRATDDFREGISSFLEKRKPKWSSK